MTKLYEIYMDVVEDEDIVIRKQVYAKSLEDAVRQAKELVEPLINGTVVFFDYRILG